MDAVESWSLVAGHPALDFLNTVEDHGGPTERDVLESAGDLLRWGVKAGLISESRAGDARRNVDEDDDLPATLQLRQHLRAIFQARMVGEPAEASDLAALAQAGADAHVAGSLEEVDHVLRWYWPDDSAATVRHKVAIAAIDLLARDDERIGRCPGEGCGWFFLDATKRGNRRWCSMRDCGQDAKSARRRAASRTG